MIPSQLRNTEQNENQVLRNFNLIVQLDRFFFIISPTMVIILH